METQIAIALINAEQKKVARVKINSIKVCRATPEGFFSKRINKKWIHSIPEENQNYYQWYTPKIGRNLNVRKPLFDFINTVSRVQKGENPIFKRGESKLVNL